MRLHPMRWGAERRMKSLEKLFFRLSDREQNLLVITLWLLLVVVFYKMVFQEGIREYSTLEDAEHNITVYSEFIKLKPSIRMALEQQKLEQKNKSYDKKNLSNRASTLADMVFPPTRLSGVGHDRARALMPQHRVKITFERASYPQVEEYASLIRQERALHVFERS